MATIDRKNNRLSLFNTIKSQFTNSSNVVLKFEEFEQLFFSTEEGCVSAKPNAADKNGYIKQNNLFDILTKPNRKGKVIKTEFFDPKDNQFISLRDKVTFVKTYACFDFDWTTKSTTKYCLGATPSNTNTNTNLDETELKPLMGMYKSDQTTDGEFRIFDATSNENISSPFKLGIMSYTYSYISGVLTEPSKSGNKLILKISIDTSSSTTISALSSFLPNVDLSTLSTIKPTITFSEDRQSFTYDIFNHKGTATKTEEKKVEKKKTDDNKTDTTNKSDDEKPYKPNQTTIHSTTTDYNKIDEPNLIVKNCSSFPFEVGCSNYLIGDLNEKFFGKRRKDTYTKLLQNHLDNMAYFSVDNEEKMITKEIWDQIMNKSIIKESVKKVLKEYINKKK